MADDVAVTPGIGASVATDEVGGRHFQRVKVTHGADGTATDVSAASPLPVDSELPPAAALTDAMANPTAPAVASHGMLWNGATWDREASKEEAELLASAARTTTTTSPVVTSPTAQGVFLVLRVTAITAPATLGLRILGHGGPSGGGNYLHSIVETPSTVDAIGRFGYMLHPGIDSADPASLAANYTTWRIAMALPRRWFCEVWVSSADPATYSLTYCTLA